MSARSLIVLALVAVVTVQANSYPYGTKGGQAYYQEPLKGQQAFHQQQQQQQPLVAESYKSAAPVVQHQSVPMTPAPLMTAQSYEAPVKGAQSFYQEPLKGSFAQQPMRQQAPVVESYRPVQQVAQPVHQQVEAAPLQTAQSYEAPAKGAQSFYQEPLKGSFVQQPLRQQAPVVESYRPVQQAAHVEAAPVQTAQTFEAPTKGAQSWSQNYYQEPLKGQFAQQPMRQTVQQVAQPVHQQVEAAPVAAPLQTAQSYEAPAKGAQSFYQEPLKGSFVQQPFRPQQAPAVESYRPMQQVAQSSKHF